MSGEMYTDHLHGIKEVKIDEELRGGQGGVCNWELLGDKGQFGEGWMERGMRVSLTFRDVKHVKKLGSAFKFMGGKR